MKAHEIQKWLDEQLITTLRINMHVDENMDVYVDEFYLRNAQNIAPKPGTIPGSLRGIIIGAVKKAGAEHGVKDNLHHTIYEIDFDIKDGKFVSGSGSVLGLELTSKEVPKQRLDIEELYEMFDDVRLDLAADKIKGIIVEFAGSGDSGGIERVFTSYEDGLKEEDRFSGLKEEDRFRSHGTSLLKHINFDWYNNEGGEGKIVIAFDSNGFAKDGAIVGESFSESELFDEDITISDAVLDRINTQIGAEPTSEEQVRYDPA